MNRVDTIWNGMKLTLIGLLTVLFILALSFENADGMSSASFHFTEPVLTDQLPTSSITPTLHSIQLNNGFMDPNYFNHDDYYRPWDGGEIIGEEFNPPTSVPEPTTLLLLGMGLAGAGIVNRRRHAR